MLLTGQAYNAIWYNRHLNVFTAAGTEKSPAKSSLKGQSKLIESQSEELFRKAFILRIYGT